MDVKNLPSDTVFELGNIYAQRNGYSRPAMSISYGGGQVQPQVCISDSLANRYEQMSIGDLIAKLDLKPHDRIFYGI